MCSLTPKLNFPFARFAAGAIMFKWNHREYIHNLKGEKSERVNCYLCSVEDPNAEHFDPQKHGICLVHAVSLWELAKEHLIFEARGSTVVMRLEKTSKKNSGSNLPRGRTESVTGNLDLFYWSCRAERSDLDAGQIIY
jgi:hypothetical protein